MGKSEGNATVWLDPKKTSPFEMYQYFFNIADADVESCLFKITFLSPEEISDVMEKHSKRPEDRIG